MARLITATGAVRPRLFSVDGAVNMSEINVFSARRRTLSLTIKKGAVQTD